MNINIKQRALVALMLGVLATLGTGIALNVAYPAISSQEVTDNGTRIVHVEPADDVPARMEQNL